MVQLLYMILSRTGARPNIAIDVINVVSIGSLFTIGNDNHICCVWLRIIYAIVDSIDHSDYALVFISSSNSSNIFCISS